MVTTKRRSPVTSTSGSGARKLGTPVFSQPAPTADPSTFVVKHASDAAAYAAIDALNKQHLIKALPFPTPRGGPEPVLTLQQAIGPGNKTTVKAIQANGRIVFHSTGDCGSTRGPKTQNEVTDKMLSDFDETHPAEVPQFALLLGDIVYSFGESQYYYDQFYEPYRDYCAPILAAAGNHDGMVSPLGHEKSLQSYLRNFCADCFQVTPEAGHLSRTAQIQPGVFFTFEAPFVRILVLYSNSLEDPGVISNPDIGISQLDYLRAALKRVKAEKFLGALLFAHHHPPYVAGSRHGWSVEMQAQIDAICNEVGVWPHADLAGHAHSYQRFTRTRKDGSEVPYIVCGNGGHNVQGLARNGGQVLRAPQVIRAATATDDQVVLENYDDRNYGYMRVIVNAQQLRLEYHRRGRRNADENTRRPGHRGPENAAHRPLRRQRHRLAQSGGGRPNAAGPSDIAPPAASIESASDEVRGRQTLAGGRLRGRSAEVVLPMGAVGVGVCQADTDQITPDGHAAGRAGFQAWYGHGERLCRAATRSAAGQREAHDWRRPRIASLGRCCQHRAPRPGRGARSEATASGPPAFIALREIPAILEVGGRERPQSLRAKGVEPLVSKRFSGRFSWSGESQSCSERIQIVKMTSVVLLHGLCSTPDELMSVDKALRDAGCQVFPLCVPGYSFDPAVGAQRATKHVQWLRTVSALARQQHALGQRVVLVGISAGATLALGALLTCADAVDGVVLMSTTLQYDGWAVPAYHFLMPLALYTPLGRFWRYRERPPYGVKNPRIRRWIERELESRRISRAGAAVIGVGHLREHDRLRRLVRSTLTRLHCPPVLVLHALEDEVASPANVSLLERHLRTPSFRAVILPNSHHMITIDNDRAQVVQETLRFIATLPPSVARSQGAALTA